jgi:CRP/FNR family transcriptional regulator, cyclic AMP receptor protein
MDPESTKSEWKFGTRAYQAGDLVFQEGDLGAEAYIVQSGEIDIIKNCGPAKEELLLGTLCEGAIFGEMALVDDECRMASAVCGKSAVLRVIPVDVFEAKFGKADPFIRALVRVLVQNARTNAAVTRDK